MSNERSALTDPQPGDVVVKICGNARKVTRRKVLQRMPFIVYEDTKTHHRSAVTIRTWRSWCRGAEVLHVAE